MRTYCVAQETTKCSVVTCIGRKSKRGDKCIPTTDSFCCTAETNTTLLDDYIPMKSKIKRTS